MNCLYNNMNLERKYCQTKMKKYNACLSNAHVMWVCVAFSTIGKRKERKSVEICFCFSGTSSFLFSTLFFSSFSFFFPQKCRRQKDGWRWPRLKFIWHYVGRRFIWNICLNRQIRWSSWTRLMWSLCCHMFRW